MSASAPFSFHHDWTGDLLYVEDADRSIAFDTHPEDPFEVHVPMSDQWREWAPAWAHERRGIILQRLRDADYRAIEVPFRRVPIPAPPPAPLRQRIVAMLCLLLGLMFVATGIWIVWLAKTPKDLWIGGLNIGFFGLCSVVFFFDLRKKLGLAPPPKEKRPVWTRAPAPVSSQTSGQRPRPENSNPPASS